MSVMNRPLAGPMIRMHLFSLCGLVLLAGAGLFATVANSGSSREQLADQTPGEPRSASDSGRAIAEASCAACHGAEGISPDPQFPKLAGQRATYLYRQLGAFKTGARRSDVMAKIAAPLSDPEMAAVARFYSRQAIRADAVTDAPLAALGQRIFFAAGGGPMAPSCSMCHGSPGQRGMGMMGGMPMMGMMGRMPMGMMADAPNLNGQHALYIVDQLNRFASGERQAMMMGRIAAMLRETDKKAVAEYLSGLQ